MFMLANKRPCPSDELAYDSMLATHFQYILNKQATFANCDEFAGLCVK